ncbi:MAG: hypothetical protein H7Y04_13605, partial [Verrucomicrobia bacterium]|nr:hypothetical protein [Cytophagales bacterium]
RMGIMHGDNSGLYAACRQVAQMHKALKSEVQAQIWEKQAEIIRLRTNDVCWNGKFYAHFIPDGSPPPYLKTDLRNSLTLSNPYDVNRGLPTEIMAQSIVQTYKDLREKTKNQSFAEWFAMYPEVQPEWAGVKAGTYVNGGVLTIVAGELAKAALQHGYEDYGVDILKRVNELIKKHNNLPVTYRPDGTIDEGIPDNWGQAAVVSAMIEGLAGVVDKDKLFENTEISPRWLAAGINQADITVAYGASQKSVSYQFQHLNRTLKLTLTGNAKNYTVRIFLPKGIQAGKLTVNGKNMSGTVEKIRESYYLVAENINGGKQEIEVKY